MAEEAKDRAHGVAILAAILGTRFTESIITGEIAAQVVTEARRIMDAAHAAEGLPSPFREAAGASQ